MMLKVIALFCVLQSIACKSVVAGRFSPNQHTRIVGGKTAEVGEAPYQCSLQVNNEHNCGCALISEKWIITATHCLTEQNIENVTILLGTNDLNEGGTRYNCRKFFPHSSYDIPGHKNDIALVRVQGTVEMTNYVQPIEYEYTPHEIQENSTMILTGWGRLSTDGELSHLLQVIKTKVFSTKICNSFYPGLDIIGQMCTFTKKGEGACYGDSGGPLTLNRKLVGIVNWTMPCAQGFPDVFAKVSYYHNWIRTVINTNE